MQEKHEKLIAVGDFNAKTSFKNAATTKLMLLLMMITTMVPNSKHFV